MKVKLRKAWKNHPKGTVLDVTDGIKEELEKLGVIDRIVLRLKPSKSKK